MDFSCCVHIVVSTVILLLCVDNVVSTVFFLLCTLFGKYYVFVALCVQYCEYCVLGKLVLVGKITLFPGQTSHYKTLSINLCQDFFTVKVFMLKFSYRVSHCTPCT